MTPIDRSRPAIEPFVGIEAAAEFLGVPKSYLYQRGDYEGVPCHRIGRHRRYKLSEVDSWLRSRSIASAA